MDVINFPDFKKWYEKNKAVWNSDAYGSAQFKLHYLDNDYARIFIKRREDVSSRKPNLIQKLERMNKVILKTAIGVMNQPTGFSIFMSRLINLEVIVIKICENILLVIGKP